MKSCDRNDNPLTDFNAKSGCQSGGSAFMCTNQSPWAVSDTLSYGFAATTIAGGTESSWCCACYELTFTSGPVAGKKLVVQATNTGGDLGSNQFDLAVSLPPVTSLASTNDAKRCLVGDLVSSTAVQQSSEHQLEDGEHNMEGYHLARNVTASTISSRPAAIGASTGSKMPTTRK